MQFGVFDVTQPHSHGATSRQVEEGISRAKSAEKLGFASRWSPRTNAIKAQFAVGGAQ